MIYFTPEKFRVKGKTCPLLKLSSGVQECDATMPDNSNTVGLPKNHCTFCAVSSIATEPDLFNFKVTLL